MTDRAKIIAELKRRAQAGELSPEQLEKFRPILLEEVRARQGSGQGAPTDQAGAPPPQPGAEAPPPQPGPVTQQPGDPFTKQVTVTQDNQQQRQPPELVTELANELGGGRLAQGYAQSVPGAAHLYYRNVRDQLWRGFKQLTGSPEEAKAMEAAEELARKKWAEFDDRQIGGEDAAEVMVSLGLMATGNPAGAAPVMGGVQLLSQGAKYLRTIKNLAGSAVGSSVLLGLLESAKATTSDESRLGKGAVAAGTALGVQTGLGVGFGIARYIPGVKQLAQTAGNPKDFVDALSLGVKRRLSRGVFADIRKKFGGSPKNYDDPMDVMKMAESQTVRGEIALAKKGVEEQARSSRIAYGEAREKAQRARQRQLDEQNSEDWDMFFNIVDGNPNAVSRTARRGIRGSPKSKDAAGLKFIDNEGNTVSDLETRDRLLGVFFGQSEVTRKTARGEVMRTSDGKPLFDLAAAGELLAMAKQDPNFRAHFGKVDRYGVWKPNKAVVAAEKWLKERMTSKPPPDINTEDFLPANYMSAEQIIEEMTPKFRGKGYGAGEAAHKRQDLRDKLKVYNEEMSNWKAHQPAKLTNRAAGLAAEQYAVQGAPSPEAIDMEISDWNDIIEGTARRYEQIRSFLTSEDEENSK